MRYPKMERDITGEIELGAAPRATLLVLARSCPQCNGRRRVWESSFDGAGRDWHLMRCPHCGPLWEALEGAE